MPLFNGYRSKIFYTGNGSEQTLSIFFPYLDPTHIHVKVADVLQDDATWDYVTSETLAITAVNNASIEIFRSTPYDPMVTFSNASLLNEDDQNMAALQAIYLIEELLDGQTQLISDVDVINTQQSTALTFVFDGGGEEIIAGVNVPLLIPFACTIVRGYILADQTGDIVVDIWKDDIASYPPTDADSITASAPLTISSDTASTDATLTGWTTAVSANDVVVANVDSITTIQRATVVLVVTRA
jgi:hypothetical protein